MKTKMLKILATILMVMFVVCSMSTFAFAGDINPSNVANDIKASMPSDGKAVEGLKSIAGQILGLVQIASAVMAVVLVAMFGFKFILGSANEKADYQKSFIPLIVGVIVVFAASSIARLIFGLISEPTTDTTTAA